MQPHSLLTSDISEAVVKNGVGILQSYSPSGHLRAHTQAWVTTSDFLISARPSPGLEKGRGGEQICLQARELGSDLACNSCI